MKPVNIITIEKDGFEKGTILSKVITDELYKQLQKGGPFTIIFDYDPEQPRTKVTLSR